MSIWQNQVHFMGNIEALDEGLCPECGQYMQEVARLDEDGDIYIWYECDQENCPGQFLRKIPAGKEEY